MTECKHRYKHICSSPKVLAFGEVSDSICAVCPYKEQGTRDFFAATSLLVRQKQASGEYKAAPKPCGGCRSEPTPKSVNVEPARSTSARFVWVYWHRGAVHDELRWSMRSVAKHFNGDAQFTVIGDRPPWYRGHWIKQRRVKPQAFRGFRDMIAKMHTLSTTNDLGNGEKLVWMMDDIYLINSVNWADLDTPRAAGWTERKSKNGWQKIKTRTMHELAKHGFTNHDYGTHMPHTFTQEKLRHILQTFNLKNHTLLWEVLYGNVFRSRPKAVRDVFARTLKKRSERWYDLAKRQKLILNNGHSAWNNLGRQWLQSQFPNPVKQERQT